MTFSVNADHHLMSQLWELIPGAQSGDDATTAAEIREIFNGKRRISVSEAFVAACEERMDRSDFRQKVVQVFQTITKHDFIELLESLKLDLQQAKKSLSHMRCSIDKLFLVFRGARVDGALSRQPLGRAKIVYDMYLDSDTNSVYDLKQIDPVIQPFFNEGLYSTYQEIGCNYLYRYYLANLVLETPAMTSADFLTHVARVRDECRDALSWKKLKEMQQYTFYQDILNPIEQDFREDPATLLKSFSPTMYSDILERNLKDYADDLPSQTWQSLLSSICRRVLYDQLYVRPLKPVFEYLVQHQSVLTGCPFFPPALLNDDLIITTVAFDKDMGSLSLGEISDPKGWRFPAFTPISDEDFYYAVFVSATAILFENRQNGKLLALSALKELVTRPRLVEDLSTFLQTSFLPDRETEALHAALIVTELFVTMNQNGPVTSWKRYMFRGVTYLKSNQPLASEFEKHMETFCLDALTVMTYIKDIPETVVTEYRLVRQVMHENYQFKVSHKCGVELVKPVGDAVCCSAVKLKIATSKLNIACPSSADSVEGCHAKKFVDYYQACEMQLSELNKLAACFDPLSDTVSKYGWHEFDQVRVHTEKFRQRRDMLVTTIAHGYVGALTQFVPSQLHRLFHLFNQQQTKNDGWTIILESLGLERPEEFRGRYHERLTPVTDLRTFITNLADIVRDEDAPRLKIPLRGDAVSFRGPTGDERIALIKDSVDRVLARAFQVSSWAETVPLILFSFFGFQKTVPQSAQLLICSPEVTVERVKSFFAFFRSANDSRRGPGHVRMFVIVCAKQLNEDSFEALNAEIHRLKRLSLGSARLIAVWKDGLESESEQQKWYATFVVYNPTTLEGRWDYSFLGESYFGPSSDLVHEMISFVSYSTEPRTGKTHLIMSDIYKHVQDNHYYLRILVDSSTTLQDLILQLRRPHIDNPNVVMCYHFNVDGKVHALFNYYILSLVLFRGLSDGQTIPFVRRPSSRFYFEFGSRRDVTFEKFVHDVFPIGEHMTRLQRPPDRDFFTYDEYFVEGNCVVFKKNARMHLIETVALLNLREDWAESRMRGLSSQSVREAFTTKKQAVMSRLSTAQDYDNLFEGLFRSRKLHSLILGSSPLISQLSDASKVVSRFKGPIFSEIYAQQEEAAEVPCPYRFLALTLLFETAVVNSAIPYSAVDSNAVATNPDERRLNLVKTVQANCKRLLIVTGPSTEEPATIRTLAKDLTDDLRHEFKINPRISDELNPVRSYGYWENLAQSHHRMLDELGQVFNFVFCNRKNFEIAQAYLVYDEMELKEREALKKNFPKEHETGRSVIEWATTAMPKKQRQVFRPPAPRVKQFMGLCESILKYHEPSLADDLKNGIEELVGRFQQYLLKNSMLLTYSLTIHNIERFIHLVYRVLSGVPTVLMGETGSGKTFSLKFLQEVLGEKTRLLSRVFDGGTEAADIVKFVAPEMADFRSVIEEFDLQPPLGESIRPQLLFFFDEVNTAPCQWFIKELLVDRYLEGQQIPDYVKFICAVNPHRALNKQVQEQLRGLKHSDVALTSVEASLRGLVYKVHQMPESFVPFLLPADPPRERAPGQEIGNLKSVTEYERGIRKVLEQGLGVGAICQSEIGDLKDGRHFSETEEFAPPFSPELIASDFGPETDPHQFHRQITDLVSNLVIFADRLMTDVKSGFYQDPSFGSLREPQRCAHLCRWLYKFGLSDLPDQKESKQGRFRRALILALSVTYWLRLSDFPVRKGEPSNRDRFVQALTGVWDSLISTNSAQVPDCIKPPDVSQWNEAIQYECRFFTDRFVDDDEGLSKNPPLCENIWAAYVCITNNIPLWIIGMPGTSKSLAVNIVLSKLFTRSIAYDKISKLPHLVHQTFMCAAKSRSEALLTQLNRVAESSMMRPGQRAMSVLLLEEIGHADLSPYLPLKCLHHVIDDGYRLDSGELVRVTLIGLSNYIVDSAKLNRGILIIRDQLAPDVQQSTAVDIFRSTARAVKNMKNSPQERISDADFGQFVDQSIPAVEQVCREYHNHVLNSLSSDRAKFLGLRDFYGLVRSLARIFLLNGRNSALLIEHAIARNFSGIPAASNKVHGELLRKIIQQVMPMTPSVDLIKENLQEEWNGLKSPLMRHILISSSGDCALHLLIQRLQLRDPVVIYADNFSGLPDEEWISNDLRRFARAMTSGKTTIFLGRHPCFDNLYDVFNLRYNKLGVRSYALISYAGDSYPIMVHERFRTIIVVEDSDYKKLPAPFLNRFEKLYLDYKALVLGGSTQMNDSVKTTIEANLKCFIGEGTATFFGCYKEEHYQVINVIGRECYHLQGDSIREFALLNAVPAAVLHYALQPGMIASQTVIDLLHHFLSRSSPLHSTISHLLYYYNHPLPDEDGIAAICYRNWKVKDGRIAGIQAVCLVPFWNDNDRVRRDLERICCVVSMIQFSDRIDKRTVRDKLRSFSDQTAVLMLIVDSPMEDQQRRINHVRFWLNKQRSKNAGQYVWHFLIVVNLSKRLGLEFVQTTDWPVVALDSLTSSLLKPRDPALKSIELETILFRNPPALFNDSGLREAFDWSRLMKHLRKQIVGLCPVEDRSVVCEIFASPEFDELLREVISKNLFRENVQKLVYCKSLADLAGSLDSKHLEPVLLDTWFVSRMRECPGPPPSLLEYLSSLFMVIIRNVTVIILQQILNGYTKLPLLNSSWKKMVRILCLNKYMRERLVRILEMTTSLVVRFERRFLNANLYELQVFDLLDQIGNDSDVASVFGDLSQFVIDNYCFLKSFVPAVVASSVLRQCPSLEISADDFAKFLRRFGKILDVMCQNTSEDSSNRSQLLFLNDPNVVLYLPFIAQLHFLIPDHFEFEFKPILGERFPTQAFIVSAIDRLFGCVCDALAKHVFSSVADVAGFFRSRYRFLGQWQATLAQVEEYEADNASDFLRFIPGYERYVPGRKFALWDIFSNVFVEHGDLMQLDTTGAFVLDEMQEDGNYFDYFDEKLRQLGVDHGNGPKLAAEAALAFIGKIYPPYMGFCDPEDD